MHVTARFFALYRDLTGVDETTVEVAAPTQASDVVALLRARGGGFARLPERPVVALNREFASLDAVVSEGDELALLPPLAGG